MPLLKHTSPHKGNGIDMFSISIISIANNNTTTKGHSHHMDPRGYHRIVAKGGLLYHHEMVTPFLPMSNKRLLDTPIYTLKTIGLEPRGQGRSSRFICGYL